MPTALPKHYPAREIEKKWQDAWEAAGLYRYDPNAPGERFAVDTPPPTVSGVIHIGHVYSYTQAEILVRYHRMLGDNVFYPFGFDDNGLPTERYVEKVHEVSARQMSREEFIALCETTVGEAEKQYEALWRTLGLSADWTQCYRTIDARSRRISQRSFLDLLAKGHLHRSRLPMLWCSTCGTALAQADLEDKDLPSHWNWVRFREIESGADIVIATTRPELLPACVALLHHPDDARYAHLAGKTARVPYSGHEVPVLADARVDPEKGTGIVMCCTFGDQTDIEWWRQFNLPYRGTFTLDGKLKESGDDLNGLKIKAAREKVAELLEAAGDMLKREPLQHAVKVHERCQTPVEFAITDQWFVNVLDHKHDLLAMGAKVKWFPEYMKGRYDNWVENLSWDWCVSRQRHYGVPIPVWYCAQCGTTLPAAESQLPVNPLVDKPLAACHDCGSAEFVPDRDVLDTWATSSCTPQINAWWGEADDRSATLMPMTIRPQAHDIIRTWAFYTIVKSFYHHGDIPWTDAVISGHVKQRTNEPSRRAQGQGAAKSKLEKISKSRTTDGSVATPMDLIEEWSADAVRYWAAGANLGTDLAYDLKEMNQGRRLLTKLYNATQFALPHLEAYDGKQPTERWPFDAWALDSFRALAGRVQQYFDGHDFFHARLEIESWFWGVLCDNYLEVIKGRLYAGLPPRPPADGSEAPTWAPTRDDMNGCLSARATLYELMLGVYKLFAPFVPHITEELYDHLVLPGDRVASIHVARYPSADDFPANDDARRAGDEAIALLQLVRRFKSEQKVSMVAPVQLVEVEGLSFTPAEAPRLMHDLATTCRAGAVRAVSGLGGEGVLEEGALKVRVTAEPAKVEE